MKKYEKPELTAIALSGSSPLCACAVDAVGDDMDPAFKIALQSLGYTDSNSSKYFETGSACAIEVDVQGYCKFGPSGQIVFNS